MPNDRVNSQILKRENVSFHISRRTCRPREHYIGTKHQPLHMYLGSRSSSVITHTPYPIPRLENSRLHVQNFSIKPNNDRNPRANRNPLVLHSKRSNAAIPRLKPDARCQLDILAHVFFTYYSAEINLHTSDRSGSPFCFNHEPHDLHFSVQARFSHPPNANFLRRIHMLAPILAKSA